MLYNSTIDLTRAIIEVLTQFKKSISLDEITFRARSTQSLVETTLFQLVRANVVIREGSNFKLNRDGQYRLHNLVI